jgi:hypothetical protein
MEAALRQQRLTDQQAEDRASMVATAGRIAAMPSNALTQRCSGGGYLRHACLRGDTKSTAAITANLACLKEEIDTR